MGRLGVNTVLGDERTLGELLRRFDQVSAEEVRAEAEVLFSPRRSPSPGPGCRPGESSQFSPGGRTEVTSPEGGGG